MRRLVGTDTSSGLIEKYMSLSMEDVACLEDMDLSAQQMRIGDNMLCLHTLSDTDDLPAKVGTDNRYERLSTDRSDCRMSFASPVGLLLPCNHIYNQYVFVDDHDENLAKFEKDRPQHEQPLQVQPFKRDQQGVDRPLSQRGAQLRVPRRSGRISTSWRGATMPRSCAASRTT